MLKAIAIDQDIELIAVLTIAVNKVIVLESVGFPASCFHLNATGDFTAIAK